MATKKTPAKKTVKAVEPEFDNSNPESVEKATETRIKAEEKVSFTIPYDPRIPADQQFWEHNVNGVTYRYPRGEEIQLPKSLADVFLRKLRLQKESAIVISEFNGKGKKLDY